MVLLLGLHWDWSLGWHWEQHWDRSLDLKKEPHLGMLMELCWGHPWVGCLGCHLGYCWGTGWDWLKDHCLDFGMVLHLVIH